MAWDPGFMSLITQEVSWERYSGEDADGNVTYDEAQIIRANVEMYSRARGTSDGPDNSSSPQRSNQCSLIVQYRSNYSERDRIVLPAGVTMAVYEVATVYDEDGPHHSKLQAREGDSI